MARRQPAAPLDPAEAQANPADTREASPDAAPNRETASAESPGTTEATPSRPRRTRRPQTAPEAVAAPVETATPQEAAPGDALPEPVAPRPRRSRKPPVEVAGTAGEAAPTDDAPVELAPIAPKRTRSRRTPVAPPATFDDVPEATADAPDAAEDIDEVFDLPDASGDAVAAPLDDEAMNEIRAESEAILEEVLAESPTEGASRNRSRSRRGRGRGKSDDVAANAASGAPGVAVALPANGVFRKRGAAVLARTMPFPVLPPSAEPPAGSPEIAPVLRKRGVRTPLATRRILTPDGVSVISAAQAATLVGSVVMVPASRTEGDIAAPSLVPRIEPVVPEYAPLAAEILERLPQVSVQKVNALPELHVNAAPVLPAFLFVNTEVADEPEVAVEIAAREIKRAYAAGVRLFTLMAHLPWRRKSGDRRYDSINAALSLIAENAPDAHMLPRLIFSPPVSWERANEDEMARYDSGEPGDVSIGSDAFWQEEAKDALRAAVEHLAQSDNAPRVLGVFLEHGEWFHPKGVGADRSPANTAAFRTFLKAHYDKSEVALRSAWHDGSVTFDTAEIPSAETLALSNASGTQPVFLSDRDRRVGDFHRYTSRMTAERVTFLARIVKEASGGRLAVATSYGYTLEIARPNCGHYALGDVLASPDIDILTAPFSYSGRLPGGSAPLPVPVDSVHLAGKLFVCEDDTKTHLALRPTDDEYNPKIATESDTRAVHTRNVGTALSKGCGISWMDLWGEGWLDDDATWEHLGALLAVMNTAAVLRRERTHPVAAPQVAVFVDEEAFFEVGESGDSPLLAQLVGQHRDVFARAGASVGYYLFTDLAKESFPDAAKLFVFLNTFCLPLDIRNAMKTRWQNNGRTFAWAYAPGVRESGNIAEFSETLGFQLRLQPWGSRTGTVVTDGRFILTENAKGERFGEEKRINPSLTVADPKAQVLGEYVNSGNPSLAYRKHARWQSVFVGERELPLPLLRGLYRLSGVNVAVSGDDAAAVAGDGFVAVHSPRDANVAVYSPTRAEAAVYDAATGEIVAGSGYGAHIENTKAATRLLFFAAPEELAARFAVTQESLQAAPEAIAETDLPVLAKPFEFEAAPVAETRRQAPAAPATPPGPPPPAQPMRLYPVELSVSEEDIAQFEAALAGEIALLDKDADEAESEPGRKKRRRRRRRGGSNGENGAENGTDTEEEGENGDDGEAEPGDVFGLSELAQAASSFDADALLPLLPQGDTEAADALGGGRLPASHSLPVDLLAEVMERLFALPELVQTKPNTVPEPPRRPTLDELLPFSNAPEDTGETQTPETLFGENRDADAALPEADPVLQEMVEVSIADSDAEADSEPMGLLSGGAVRTRRSSGGGFASRLRRRAAERAPGDENEDAAPTEAVEADAETVSPTPEEDDTETA